MVSAQTRQQVREFFQFRCAYCGVSESENLVYSCHACNEFKSDYWRSEGSERILHPMQEDMTLHLRENENGDMEGLTETGIFHIARLHLNREPLVLQRQIRRRRQQWEARMLALESRLETAEAQLERQRRRHRRSSRN
jgi:hypothetical protein